MSRRRRRNGTRFLFLLLDDAKWPERALAVAAVKALSFSSDDKRTTKCHPTYRLPNESVHCIFIFCKKRKEAHVTASPHEINNNKKHRQLFFFELFDFPKPFFFKKKTKGRYKKWPSVSTFFCLAGVMQQSGGNRSNVWCVQTGTFSRKEDQDHPLQRGYKRIN